MSPEEASYRAAMAPPIQILPVMISEMQLMGIMNLQHFGVAENACMNTIVFFLRHTHQNAG